MTGTITMLILPERTWLVKYLNFMPATTNIGRCLHFCLLKNYYAILTGSRIGNLVFLFFIVWLEMVLCIDIDFASLK